MQTAAFPAIQAGFPMDSRNVGTIGLGLMGTAFTERLLESGYSVWVHNRTREKADPLVALGARWADNPLTVCERVIISLYTTDTVEAVLEQLADGLRPGQILIDTTTGSPQQSAALGVRLNKDFLEIWHWLPAESVGICEPVDRSGYAAAMIVG